MPITLALNTNQIITQEMKIMLDEAVQLDHENPSAYYTRGQVELKLGKYQAARENFLKARTLGGKKEHCIYYQGLVKFEEEKYPEAIVDFSKVIDSNKDKVAEAYFYRGLTLNRQGYRKEALKDLTTAIENSQKMSQFLQVRALNVRGTLNKEDKKFQPALADFTQAAALDDNNTYAHHNIGIVARSIAQNLISTVKSSDTARLNNIERYFRTSCTHLQRAAEIFPEGHLAKQKMLHELKETKDNFEKFRENLCKNKSDSSKSSTAFFSKPAPAKQPIQKQNTTSRVEDIAKKMDTTITSLKPH